MLAILLYVTLWITSRVNLRIKALRNYITSLTGTLIHNMMFKPRIAHLNAAMADSRFSPSRRKLYRSATYRHFSVEQALQQSDSGIRNVQIADNIHAGSIHGHDKHVAWMIHVVFQRGSNSERQVPAKKKPDCPGEISDQEWEIRTGMKLCCFVSS